MQPKRSKDEFSTIIDSLGDEVLDADEKEIAELYSAAELDPNAGPNRIANVLTETLNAFRRKKLQAARAGYDQLRGNSGVSAHSIPADIRAQRDLLAEICTKSNVAQGLTMRFRDGKGMSDSDVTSVLEDLQSLGVLKEK